MYILWVYPLYQYNTVNALSPVNGFAMPNDLTGVVLVDQRGRLDQWSIDKLVLT